jgi:predicted dehydrogenase
MRHRVAIVGLGAIGMGYDLANPAKDRVCTHARAFSLSDDFGPLIGIDPDADKRRIFDEVYGGPSYQSLEAGLQEHHPTVVVIATPTAAHSSTLERVVQCCMPRLILCEKPLAHDPATATAMLAACKQREIALYVNYMRRADPGVIAFKTMIEQSSVIAPLKGVVWYSKGLIHNGSHFVDLMRYWLGAVESASVVRRGRRWEGRDPEPDFILDFALGSISFFAANEERFSHYTAEIIAQNGRLRYERGGESVKWQDVVDDAESPGYRVLSRQQQVLPADMSKYQMNVVHQLVSAVAGGKSTLCTGTAALETLCDVHRVIELL